MSEGITSTLVKNQLNTDEKQNASNKLNDDIDNNATTLTLESETINKTPITSATTFNEDLENENKNALVLMNESSKNTEPTESFNETECVKFAEKLYKVSWKTSRRVALKFCVNVKACFYLKR